jgi:hypothetical protein
VVYFWPHTGKAFVVNEGLMARVAQVSLLKSMREGGAPRLALFETWGFPVDYIKLEPNKGLLIRPTSQNRINSLHDKSCS